MSKAEEFIEAYKKMEADVRTVFHMSANDSIVSELKQRRQFMDYKDEIQSCANLRNYYQHTAKLDNLYAAEPSDEAIAFVRFLDGLVLNRKRCKDICVRFEDVFWRRDTDSVLKTVGQMRDIKFTHVPILKNGIVIGVFDENALFSYLSETASAHSKVELDMNLTFDDISEYLTMNGRKTEAFEFVGKDKYIDDVEDMFEEFSAHGKRLELVFVTKTGKNTEPLRGILTLWDIIKCR